MIDFSDDEKKTSQKNNGPNESRQVCNGARLLVRVKSASSDPSGPSIIDGLTSHRRSQLLTPSKLPLSSRIPEEILSNGTTVGLDSNFNLKKIETKSEPLQSERLSLTKLSFNSETDQHPDSFFKSMRPLILLAQFFSLLPISGITGSNYKSLKFRWIHWKTLNVAFSISGMIFMLFCSLDQNFKTGFSYDKSMPAVFFLCSILNNCFLIQIARNWPEVNRDFTEIEFKLSKYNYPKRLGIKFKIIIVIFLIIAAVEHGLSQLTGFLRIVPCAKIKGDTSSLLEAFFINGYHQAFSRFPYSLWTGILMLYFNLISTFTWNYCDLFLALVSMSISEKFKQLNQALFKIQFKEKSISFWRTAREDYNELSLLTKRMDSHLQKLILLSLANNLYFICLQLLRSLKKRINVYQVLYFFWSFGFLLGRTCFMAFCAAGINDQSKEATTVLYSVPQSSYCSETRRFLIQLTTNDVALTGCKFFSVTRGLILTIAGTVITYEIVLVQFNTVGVEIWPTEENKTSCATI